MFFCIPPNSRVCSARAFFSSARGAVFLLAVLFAGRALGQIPIITSQPVSQVVNPGQSATFSVTASNAPVINFQWKRNGVLIPGTQSTSSNSPATASLSIQSTQPTNCGTYSVVAWTIAGAVNSSNATLVVTNIYPIPASNTFALRGTLPYSVTGLGAGTGRGTTVNATKESGEPNHGGVPGGASVWLKWTAQTTGIATFDTIGSGFDTTLGVYKGTNVGALTLVARDEDSGLYGTNNFLNSRVQFNVVDGQEYEIAIDGFYGAKGNYVLRWSTETTTDLLPEIIQQPSSATVGPGGSTQFKVTLTNFPVNATVSYQWVVNGTPIITAGGSSYTVANASSNDVGQYVVAVSLQVAGGNFPRTIYSEPAQLQINITDGSSFDPSLLAKAKFRAESDISGPGLNSVAAAAGYSGTQILNTYGAIKEDGEPNHCGEVGGATYWFSYQPAVSGTLTVDSFGTDFNNVLAAYIGPGDSYVTLTNVGCANSYAGNGNESMAFAVIAGTNYFIVSDGVGGATGNLNIDYSLAASPSITSQPTNRTVNATSNTTFSVTAAGTPTLTYQWRLNATTNIVNATNASLTITNCQSTNAGNYTVVITNASGSITSSIASLTVNSPPSITNQPANLTVLAGSNSTFTVGATGSAPLKYQWTFNVVTNIAYGTNASLTVTNAQNTNAGNYAVVVTNSFGSVTSSAAALAVNTPPSITNQPQSQTVNLSSNATLTVGANGSTPLSYQWRTNSVSYAGRITNSMTVTNFQATNEGSYDVVVTNSYGAVTSVSASLYYVLSNRSSRFTNWSYPTNTFVLTLLGTPGSNYAILVSTNFTNNFSAVSTNSSLTGIIPLAITNASRATNVLIRARNP